MMPRKKRQSMTKMGICHLPPILKAFGQAFELPPKLKLPLLPPFPPFGAMTNKDGSKENKQSNKKEFMRLQVQYNRD